MTPVLNKGCRVHRADEQRQENRPVVERRAVQVAPNPAGEQEAREHLNERFHEGTLA
jgi:hypothetical protein